jgi:hypothetical protein
MAARGVRLLKGKEPLLRQLIFELRYRHGFVYLDRCGKTLNRITREQPEWVIGNEVTPQGAPLYSMRNRCRFTFSSSKLDLTLDNTTADEPISEEERTEFVNSVGLFSAIIIDELGVNVFPRMGVRGLYYFAGQSKKESEDWLQSLQVFSVSPKLTSSFQAQLEAVGLSVVLTGQDCRFRIAFNGVETPAQLDMGGELLTVRASALPQDQRQVLLKQLSAQRRRTVNSGYAVVIDIDAYHEDPPSPDPREFADRQTAKFLDTLRTLLT